MTSPISRRGLLGGLAALAATPAVANAPLSSPRPAARPGSVPVVIRDAQSLVLDAGLSGLTAFAVGDASGEIAEAGAADAPLPPASVAKAMTALYALDALGPSYRFATALRATGPIEEGIVQGDLILQGTGDPIFDTDALAGLAEELQTAGITGITGRFLVDGSAVPEQYQIDPSQPVQVGYNPSVSGLNLNYNRVHFEWKRAGESWQLNMDARARLYQPQVKVATMRLRAEASPVYTYELGEQRERWTVARPALGNGGARWLPVRRPSIYAGDVFRTLATGFGCQLPSPQVLDGVPSGAVVATHVSPTLRGLAGGMLRYSTNLTAEVLGIRASQARGAQPADLAGSASEMNAWLAERFGVGMSLVDHSGLGDASRVTARDLVRMMGQAGADQFAPILKEFALRGSDGAPLASPPAVVRAKTGSLNFVSTLSGYVLLGDGRSLPFAILSADLERRQATASPDVERPEGAQSWARRARRLQNTLLMRWAQVYA